MKMIVMFRRRSDLTPEQFRNHYEHQHAPLALQLFPYLKTYRRNYIRHDLTHKRAVPEGSGSHMAFDVITEITFECDADYHRMMRDMSDPAIRDQVVADEQRFLDRTATVVFLVEETETRAN